MEIIGYKCFNKDMTNRYGKKFELLNEYLQEGKISFGNNGNGFHYCKNIEDTFRYFDAFNNEVNIAIVKGYGDIVTYCDDYNGYYDMYSSSNIQILKVLSREEIINIGLSLNEIRVCRFIQGIKLSDDEIELFKEKFSNYPVILKYIDYYQLKNTNAFLTK